MFRSELLPLRRKDKHNHYYAEGREGKSFQENPLKKKIITEKKKKKIKNREVAVFV